MHSTLAQEKNAAAAATEGRQWYACDPEARSGTAAHTAVGGEIATWPPVAWTEVAETPAYAGVKSAPVTIWFPQVPSPLRCDLSALLRASSGCHAALVRVSSAFSGSPQGAVQPGSEVSLWLELPATVVARISSESREPFVAVSHSVPEADE